MISLKIMTIKLDLKDRKILWELDQNSRQPLSEIAKKVRLSKEAVYYRIKNLEQRKVITGWTLFVSLAKLNLMHVKLLIKFQNLSKDKRCEIIDYLVRHENTNWVGTCNGTYDMIVGFVIKDLIEFNKVKEDFFNKYSEYILKSQNSIMLEAYIYGRKYLLNQNQEIKHYIGTPQQIRLDNLDMDILGLLSGNTRLKVTKIASCLKTTARKVAYKIKQLETNCIIQKYSISINHALLGISFFKSFIFLKNTQNKSRLLYFLANQKNCLHNVEALSEWNLEPEFEVYSTAEFYKIIEELEDKFSNQIKTIDMTLISKEHKFRPLPQILFEKN